MLSFVRLLYKRKEEYEKYEIAMMQLISHPNIVKVDKTWVIDNIKAKVQRN